MSESRTPTHICIDCGALGYAGGYHRHYGIWDSAGDTISLADLLKQWHELSRDIEDAREEVRGVIENSTLVAFDAEEITVRISLDQWAALLGASQWGPPYVYPCCGTFEGCGGPCAAFPHWELTT